MWAMVEGRAHVLTCAYRNCLFFFYRCRGLLYTTFMRPATMKEELRVFDKSLLRVNDILYYVLLSQRPYRL